VRHYSGFFPTLSTIMRLNRTTFLFTIALAGFVETIIILYNNATGYVVLHSPLEFLVRLSIGTVAATPAAALLFILDSAIIRALDASLPWEGSFSRRIAAETAIAAIAGAASGAVLTLLVHAASPYSDGLLKNIVNNALIAGVLNLLVMTGLEAFIASRRTAEERRRAEVLEREVADIRFAVLKSQLNPHFLFNSLNVLSSLIRLDQAGAQRFVDEFAAVYRYILEVIDLPVVPLRRELAFARSYLFLQSIRFADAVRVDIDVATDQLDLEIPPLALQTVLENAFKHNRASRDEPLQVSISGHGGLITVTNTLQPRNSGERSTGVGLENLRRRFAHLDAPPPRFTLSHHLFIAELPLLGRE
jgi:two-component system, LytTR family, sensor kinase